MRCRKHHPEDLTSTIGVCASCLRERLISIIAAQEKAHQARVSSRASDPTPPPPPLVFPRSVSPYVSRRKSDYASWHTCDNRINENNNNNLFYSTPQLGPTGNSNYSQANSGLSGSRTTKKKKFWIFSSLFRSRSDKLRANQSIPSQESNEASSSGSPSWFSTIFPSRKKNIHIDIDRMNSLEGSSTTGRRRYKQSDRGMSPVTNESSVVDCDGYSTESSPRWRKTPNNTVSFGTRRSRHVRHVTGMGFCLSPLVRASPNPHWKGLSSEVVTEVRGLTVGKPHLSTASSFCANRSRKLVDFGRANHVR